MLADKTLLSVTLAAAFASGTFVGFAAKGSNRGAGAPPMSPDVIYAPQLAEFEAKGYDESEMAEARQAHADYLKGYQTWWEAFLDAHRANTDLIDAKLDKRLAALEARHLVRTRAK